MEASDDRNAPPPDRAGRSTAHRVRPVEPSCSLARRRPAGKAHLQRVQPAVTTGERFLNHSLRHALPYVTYERIRNAISGFRGHEVTPGNEDRKGDGEDTRVEGNVVHVVA